MNIYTFRWFFDAQYFFVLKVLKYSKWMQPYSFRTCQNDVDVYISMILFFIYIVTNCSFQASYLMFENSSLKLSELVQNLRSINEYCYPLLKKLCWVLHFHFEDCWMVSNFLVLSIYSLHVVDSIIAVS